MMKSFVFTNESCVLVGRNGPIKTNGAEVMQTAGGKNVMISPLTSRLVPANGFVEIPCSVMDEICQWWLANRPATQPQEVGAGNAEGVAQ